MCLASMSMPPQETSPPLAKRTLKYLRFHEHSRPEKGRSVSLILPSDTLLVWHTSEVVDVLEQVVGLPIIETRNSIYVPIQPLDSEARPG